MKDLRRVVWTKGMFLTPQHFQAQDRFFEGSLHFRFAASSFANWGVAKWVLDDEALANGLFRLEECRGLLPDGTAFDMPGTDELPAGREFSDHFPPERDSLDVFLALPERRARQRTTTLAGVSPGGQSDTRYRAQVVTAHDENSPEEEQSIQLAQRCFRFLFKGEALDGYALLRIARIVRTPSGTFAIDPRFAPPCLDIAASHYIMNLTRGLLEVLSTKSNSLSAPRRQKSASLADFTSSELADYWLLHTVNSYLPVLDHIWRVRRGHPESLFVDLLQLAGALSTFSLREDPRQFPKYDHDNLGDCFTALDEKVRIMLQVARPVNCIAVPLTLTGKFVWDGSIAEDYYFEGSQFYLSVSAALGVDDLIREVSRRIKVASPEEIESLIKHALPGLTIRHAPTPPSAIRIKLENQYFSLNQSGPIWENIRKTRKMSLFVPPEIQNPKLELLIVLQ